MPSNNFNAEAYAQDTKVAIITLLTITSDELTEDIHVCDVPCEKFDDLGENVYGCTSNGTRFIFMPFEPQYPRDDKTGTITATIKFENVDRRIVSQIRSVTKPVTLKIQAVLSSDVDFVELEYDDFRLSDVSYDCFYVTGSISLEYFGLEPFPSGRFTPGDFPGLF